MGTHRTSLVLTVEAESEEHLQKLLELALFDLTKLQRKSWAEEVGSVVPSTMSGDMGSYELKYTIGTKELVALREQLLAEGYQHSADADFLDGTGYNCYEHPEGKPAKRLYFDPPRIGEEDGSF